MKLEKELEIELLNRYFLGLNLGANLVLRMFLDSQAFKVTINGIGLYKMATNFKDTLNDSDLQYFLDINQSLTFLNGPKRHAVEEKILLCLIFDQTF